MNLKHLTVVGIRVISLLWMIKIGLGLTSFVFMVLPSGSGGVTNWPWSYMATSLVLSIVQMIVGLIVFLFAFPIANFVCAGIPENEESSKNSIGPGDLYHIAAFCFGLYMIFQSINPVTQAIIGLFDSSPNSIGSSATALSLIRGGLYLTFGLGLIMGSKGIAKFMTSLGHQADDIPGQQFSMRLILFIVILVAVVLGVARMLVNP